MPLAKRRRSPLHNRHRMKLNSVADVLAEQQRLYRLAVNSRIRPGEMTKMMFGLVHIRGSIETLAAAEAEATARANAERPTLMSIVAVPTNHFIKTVEGVERADGPLILEHMPAPEIIDRAREIAKPADPRTELEAKLASMTRQDLLALAGVSDEDD
jgi:hypothetical protein